MLVHQNAFIDTLRGGQEMRKRIFDVLAQRHSHDFGNGGAGVRYYETLLAIVREAEIPEAVEEFQHRFHPLLNRDRSPGRADSGPSREMLDRTKEDRRSGALGWMVAGAVVIVGAAVGLNTLKTATAKPPVATAAPAAAAAPTAPEPESVASEEPEQATPAAEQNAP